MRGAARPAQIGRLEILGAGKGFPIAAAESWSDMCSRNGSASVGLIEKLGSGLRTAKPGVPTTPS
jgi:hypothetical protein